jgi:hypothetical protein
MNSGIRKDQSHSQQRMMPLAESLRELQELGCPVDVSVATAQSPYSYVAIQQSGCIHDSKVFELEDGRTGWMVDLEICNLTSRSVYIVQVDLRFPWEDDSIEWLIPHTIKAKNRGDKAASSYEVYRFPGKYGLELPAEDVINNRLLEKKILPARHPISGWLLATGGLMPRNLLNGGWVESRLVLTVSDHTQFCQPIRLWSERLERKRRSTPRTHDVFGKRIQGHIFENILQTRPLNSSVPIVEKANSKLRGE